MDVDLLVAQHEERDPTALAVRAEELGYGTVWFGELWGVDAFVRLTDIAHQTERIGLATGIVNVFSRSPAVIAMAAVTLSDVSDGRFTLGLGTATRKSVEDLHGEEFHRPVRQAHETIEIVRAYTSGSDERVSYDGELLQVEDFPALEADVPIYYASLGPTNRRVVGRLCDGWLPHNIPFSRLDSAFEMVETAASDRGRDPEEITVAPYVPAAVSDDPEEARYMIRRHVAWYIANGEGYRKAIGSKYPSETEQIRSAWDEEGPDDAAAHVTDEMVDDLGVAGTPERARERLRTLADRPMVDRLIVNVPKTASSEVNEQTLAELAPDRLEFV